MKLTIELTPEQAAALARFAEKSTHEHARSVLYGHLPRELRAEQSHVILQAFAVLEKALHSAGARSWPWVETGQV